MSDTTNSSQGFVGFLQPDDRSSPYLAHAFIIAQLINQIATIALVKVMKVTNNGGLAPVGFVDVMPMVHQVTDTGVPTPHGIIHNIPYFRLQGGTNAIIIDPAVNDIGICTFCSRDISGIKRTKDVGPPGTARKYDWADGLYIGGVLNGVPTQYIRHSPNGIEVVSPKQINLIAPIVQINASTEILVNTPQVNGDLHTTGLLTNNNHDVGSIHQHTASGGTGVGGPPQ